MCVLDNEAARKHMCVLASEAAREHSNDKGVRRMGVGWVGGGGSKMMEWLQSWHVREPGQAINQPLTVPGPITPEGTALALTLSPP